MISFVGISICVNSVINSESESNFRGGYKILDNRFLVDCKEAIALSTSASNPVIQQPMEGHEGEEGRKGRREEGRKGGR
jgi:hypothetical protein